MSALPRMLLPIMGLSFFGVMSPPIAAAMDFRLWGGRRIRNLPRVRGGPSNLGALRGVTWAAVFFRGNPVGVRVAVVGVGELAQEHE